MEYNLFSFVRNSYGNSFRISGEFRFWNKKATFKDLLMKMLFQKINKF